MAIKEKTIVKVSNGEFSVNLKYTAFYSNLLNILFLLFRDIFLKFWPINQFIAVIIGLSFLFSSGFWISFIINNNYDYIKDFKNKFSKIIFKFTLIISFGIITIFFYVLINIIFFKKLHVLAIYIFVVINSLVSIIFYIKYGDKKEPGIALKLSIFKDYLMIFQVSISFLWFFGYLFNSKIIQIVSFCLLSIGILVSIRTKKTYVSYFSIIILLLFTRIFIYKDNFIMGVDGVAHFKHYLEIKENPMLIFNISEYGISFISPLLYLTLMMLDVFGGYFILPFTFIGINIIFYLNIFALIRNNFNLQVSIISFLFAIIEFLSFRYGFEIRTSIMAYLFLSLWLHSLFKQNYSKKDNILHIFYIVFIFLTHITTAFIVLSIEIILSFIIILEHILQKKGAFKINSNSYTFFSKIAYIFAIGAILLFIFHDFTIPLINEFLPSFGWLMEAILGYNINYLPNLDISAHQGISGAYLGVFGIIITWIGRVSVLIMLLYVFIAHFKELINLFVSNQKFRLLIYFTFSFGFFFLFTLIFSNIIGPSRIYALFMIPLGIFVGISGSLLNNRKKIIVDLIIIIFILYTAIRYSQIFESEYITAFFVP